MVQSRVTRRCASLLLFLLLALAGARTASSGGDPPSDGEAALTITDRLHHLGDSPKPEWKDFTTVEPVHATRLELDFECHDRTPRLALELQAGDVEQFWRVRLNEQDLGALKRGADLATQYFAVAPGTVKEGKNRLVVSAFRGGDDIYVGKAVLHAKTVKDLLGYARVSVHVRDAASGDGIPCRLTIAKTVERKDSRGATRTSEELVELAPSKEEELAARKGIIYTKKGAATFEVVPGKYALYATRGFEYGVAVARLDLARHEEKSVDLELRREVDTTGFLAADTHIHTRTYSGHGDINVEERVITIAGEGIEIAVATDHNHHTDYAPVMEKMGVKEDFTSIVGNEVTTSWGHFNAFPVKKDAKPADSERSDWEDLVKAMRAMSGVRLVIVNHPRRTLADAFGHVGLNSVSGEAHRGPQSLGIDAVEVFNGKTLEADSMLTIRDWFGMLNRGYRVAAVAGSDSHAVDEIVGQARTYVASSTDDLHRARIDEICDAFQAGRLLVSLGLLALVEVDGKHGPGDLATGLGAEVDVKVTVRGPSWTRADSVALYLNGVEARREKIEPSERTVKYEATWRIPRPAHDAHLVIVATGPPVTAPYWPVSTGDKGEKRYICGVTNPVWLDGDGDGKFTAAMEYATRLFKEHGACAEGARIALRDHDAAVAAQYASLARAEVQAGFQAAYERLLADADARLSEALGTADADLKKGFAAYLAAAPKLDVYTRAEKDAKEARLKKEEDDRKRKAEEERQRARSGARGPGAGRRPPPGARE